VVEEEKFVDLSALGYPFLHDEPNNRIFKKQKIILNTADLEHEGGQEAESSSNTLAIFYVFIIMQ
jgi:hypothetical protein